MLKIVQSGLNLHITNEGYNNVLFKVTNFSETIQKQVALPNDHLNDEKMGNYLELMINDVLEAVKKDKEEREKGTADLMDGLYCEDCRQSLETCNCDGLQERPDQLNA